MKFIVLILLGALVVWVISIAWANRRKSPYDNRDSGGGSGGGDSGDSFSSHCNDSDSGGCDSGGCDGGGDGGGGGD